MDSQPQIILCSQCKSCAFNTVFVSRCPRCFYDEQHPNAYRAKSKENPIMTCTCPSWRRFFLGQFAKLINASIYCHKHEVKE